MIKKIFPCTVFKNSIYAFLTINILTGLTIIIFITFLECKREETRISTLINATQLKNSEQKLQTSAAFNGGAAAKAAFVETFPSDLSAPSSGTKNIFVSIKLEGKKD